MKLYFANGRGSVVKLELISTNCGFSVGLYNNYCVGARNVDLTMDYKGVLCGLIFITKR